MELKEFVRETLVQVIAAVSEAQPKGRELGADICPSFSNIGSKLVSESMYAGTEVASMFDFDVAISATDSKTGGAKLTVVALALGGSLGGDLTSETATVSRIRFKIPVFLPSPGSVRAQPATN